MSAATKPITVGAEVKFDSDHGIQLGKVMEIRADVTNGRRVAVVHVDGTMNSHPWRVPVDELQHARAA